MSSSNLSMQSINGHNEDNQPFLVKKRQQEEHSFCDVKVAAFISIGVVTLIYVVFELGAGAHFKSLVLLSDGFHNLSDVVSLYIAYWAQQAQKRDLSDAMSYGWVRTEILGGLTNGCFLLAICMYVILESIPKFYDPIAITDNGGWYFIAVAACGLAVNSIGTLVFCLTGQGHSHGGGGGHSHSHGGHGHSHGEKKEKKKKKEGHSHSHANGGDHSHSHGHKEKKEKKKEKHGHSHGGHGHDHKKKDKKKVKKDMNVHAVFLHYLGDAISSLMVLGAGLFMHFFEDQKWVMYIDPVSSLLIVGLILWTTVPLVKRCSMILLQSTPHEIEMDKVRINLLSVEGLLSVHDLHVWQLVDGMIIASAHVAVEEGADFTNLVNEVKRIFHEFGIHSTSIQPEFVPRNFQNANFCEQNCVKECDEDWCCRKTAVKQRKIMEQFSITTEV